MDQRPRKFLVTGAAGFIGSHLCERLLDLGQTVTALDNLSTGLQSNIDLLKTNKNAGHLNFILGDICEPATCRKALEGVEIVFHQAALGSVPRSIKEPIETHASNVTGFLNMLVASTEAKVERFVYASSSAVYGDEPNLPKREGAEGKVLSPYAATKLMDEVYANVFALVNKTPVVGLRYFNVFGPRQNPLGPYAAVIPLWIDGLVKGESIFIDGDGQNSRDFCYIENVIRANLLSAIAGEEALGQVYNVGCGERTTLMELFDLIKVGLLAGDDTLNIRPPTHREGREGDIPHSLADISKANKILGYEPSVSVKEGILETTQFHLDRKLRLS